MRERGGGYPGVIDHHPTARVAELDPKSSPGAGDTLIDQQWIKI
jgi:hypothetical protein